MKILKNWQSIWYNRQKHGTRNSKRLVNKQRVREMKMESENGLGKKVKICQAKPGKKIPLCAIWVHFADCLKPCFRYVAFVTLSVDSAAESAVYSPDTQQFDWSPGQWCLALCPALLTLSVSPYISFLAEKLTCFYPPPLFCETLQLKRDRRFFQPENRTICPQQKRYG